MARGPQGLSKCAKTSAIFRQTLGKRIKLKTGKYLGPHGSKTGLRWLTSIGSNLHNFRRANFFDFIAEALDVWGCHGLPFGGIWPGSLPKGALGSPLSDPTLTWRIPALWRSWWASKWRWVVFTFRIRKCSRGPKYQLCLKSPLAIKSHAQVVEHVKSWRLVSLLKP
jgi:hypothetical protein